MDNSQAPSSILDTLRTVEFRLGLKGYNVDEVDEYLDKAAQEAEALQEHVRQLNERLRQASERIAQLERDKRAAPAVAEAEAGAAAAAAADTALSDETLQRTLLLAQKFVDQTKRESEAEAAAVVARAEETARAAIAAAEATAAQLQAETHQKLREEVTRLESTRTELAADVESMARHLESERNRLRVPSPRSSSGWTRTSSPPTRSWASSPSPPWRTGIGRAAAPEADDGTPTLNLQRVRRCRVRGAPSDLTSPLGGDGGIAPDPAVRYRHPLPGRGFRQGMGPRRVVRRRER